MPLTSAYTTFDQYLIWMKATSPVSFLMKLFLFTFLALATPVFAQLTWQNPEQTFTPKPFDKEVITKYRFTNTGSSAITIDQVRPSCGCTTAALAKKQYAPGESGEIEVKFAIEGRTGRQEKSILVTTTSTPNQPMNLRLVVNIPETVAIQPAFVMWQIGDQATPKTIRITVPDEIPAKIISVKANNPAVKLELHEVRPGKDVEVSVTPPNTSRPVNASLLIQTDYPPEDPVMHYAYVLVK
jgi:hypothetical protein